MNNITRRRKMMRRVVDGETDKYEYLLMSFQNKLNSLDTAPRDIQNVLDAVYRAIDDALYDLEDLGF